MGLELGEIRYIVQSVPCGSGSTVQLRSEGVGRSQTRSLYACLFCDGCRCPSWSTIVSLEMRFAVRAMSDGGHGNDLAVVDDDILVMGSARSGLPAFQLLDDLLGKLFCDDAGHNPFLPLGTV